MRFVSFEQVPTEAFEALFVESFTASEGAEEGARIGVFVRALRQTPPSDLWGFAALNDTGDPTAGVVFSRMSYDQDPRAVAILSPMAVSPAHQRQGLGQRLIRHGLDQLAARGLAAVLTYGDPAFYGKLGFHAITTNDAAAPYPLSYPHGWLGLALGRAWSPVSGQPTCAPALADPALW